MVMIRNHDRVPHPVNAQRPLMDHLSLTVISHDAEGMDDLLNEFRLTREA